MGKIRKVKFLEIEFKNIKKHSKLKAEGSEVSEKIGQLKMRAADGKKVITGKNATRLDLLKGRGRKN